MTKLLIADDDPLTMAGVAALLANTNFHITMMVKTGTEVLDNLAKARPDMLVLDNGMPERSGLDVLRVLRTRGDNRPVILLSGSMTDRIAREAIELGVNGIVIKGTAPRDLLPCLESVGQGRRWIDQDIMQRIVELAMAPAEARRDPFAALSARERAVSLLARRGLRNKEIARELGLTEGTVKVHLHKIFEKLQIKARTELILIGQQADA